jgi:hypothetical protein
MPTPIMPTIGDSRPMEMSSIASALLFSMRGAFKKR